jgi:hypothetical protein
LFLGRSPEELLSSGLAARDFPSDHDLRIILMDGSMVRFRYAFAIESETKRAIAVFTEHCGYHVFPHHEAVISRVPPNREKCVVTVRSRRTRGSALRASRRRSTQSLGLRSYGMLTRQSRAPNMEACPLFSLTSEGIAPFSSASIAANRCTFTPRRVVLTQNIGCTRWRSHVLGI